MASHRTDSAKKIKKSKKKSKHPAINRPHLCDICRDNGGTMYASSITKVRGDITIHYCHAHYIESLCASSGCVGEPTVDSDFCRSCRK